MAPDALVFDFDGLILDTETSEFETIAAEFATHGLTLDLATWQQFVGRADHPHWLDQLEALLGRPLDDREAVRARRVTAHRARVAQETVRPGVEALLDAAAAQGRPVAVASSSTTSWVEPHLERLGLRHHFEVVICRDHVERAKPWPDLYLAAVAAVDADPARSVALEDSHHGCAAARAAGLACVVVPNTVTRSQDFAHASLVAECLSHLEWELLASLVEAVAGGVESAGEEPSRAT
ncbi:MAG: HAD-IA family hydrolase [Acidimicrobiia bacterium]|nr:HAD-IA family hydrolase [Acidimicrobiia bacterium]